MMPFVLNRHNGVSFYQFANLKKIPDLYHAVFTRKDGVSPAPFKSLNASHGVGDTAENVDRNRTLMKQSLPANELLFVRQVHGTDILILSEHQDFRADNSLDGPPVGDAIITDRKGIFIAVQVADCQPVLLYDTDRKVVAIVHVGWRGNVANILGLTVAAMQKEFTTNTRNIIAGIGPSLGPCCAEFIHYRQELPESFSAYKDHNHHFNFWDISRDQLLAAGLAGSNIFTSNICTRCNTDQFFSYRGERTTGRFAAVIGLT
jgi:YfiH family protein